MGAVPVPEVLSRLSEDPAFWAAMNGGATDEAAADWWPTGEFRISFPVAGGYGLVLDIDLTTGDQHLGLRQPAATEPTQLGWAAPDRPHPAALRWWELDLCARVIALDDPTVPHPGLVVALLSPFAPATPDDHVEAITATRVAAYRSLNRRAPVAAPEVNGPEQAPLPLFTEPHWWPRSMRVLDDAAITARLTPPATRTEVRGGPRFPHDALEHLLRHAAQRLTRLPAAPEYADARPLARRITATGDLAQVPALVATLTEAGCDHPTVLDALSEPLVAVEACWMVETLAGVEPGTLVRHHV
jgi:hypothetical protein